MKGSLYEYTDLWHEKECGHEKNGALFQELGVIKWSEKS